VPSQQVLISAIDECAPQTSFLFDLDGRCMASNTFRKYFESNIRIYAARSMPPGNASSASTFAIQMPERNLGLPPLRWNRSVSRGLGSCLTCCQGHIIALSFVHLLGASPRRTVEIVGGPLLRSPAQITGGLEAPEDSLPLPRTRTRAVLSK
jgi:hypothetical protein